MTTSSAFARKKEMLLKRWSEEDYPGGTPRFQPKLLIRDLVVFVVLPLMAIVFYKVCENAITSGPSKRSERKTQESKGAFNDKRSQIIQFQSQSASRTGSAAFSKRAPGTLVRVRLLNAVETYSNTPVHVQIVDNNLGASFLGGTILGEASSEEATSRIKITFNFVRHPKRLDIAVPVQARAMSLDGTFGLTASKKEGFFARAAIRSASGSTSASGGLADGDNLKTMVARALAQGLMQEFQAEAGLANTKAQVLTLKPGTEFFIELTDFFPGKMQ